MSTSTMLPDCPIKLLPHQIKHVSKTWDVLVNQGKFAILDVSEVGMGKTFCTLKLARNLQRKYGLKVFLVAPSDCSLYNDDGWIAHAEEYGVEFEEATTYSSLRGNCGRVKHPWLIPDPNDKKNWHASEEFAKLCKKGVVLIFDEVHHTKNSTQTHFASAALVRTAKKYRENCRVILLSHTPGDKGEHAISLLRMSGVVSQLRLFRHIPFTHDYEIEGYGLGELANYCKKLDPDRKYEIDSMMNNLSKAKATRIAKELYIRYIRSRISFAMPVPKKDFKVTSLNAFLETDLENIKLLEDGVDVLSRAVKYENGEAADKSEWNLANIAIGLRMIERSKLVSFARYVVNEAKKNRNKKFIISCGAFATEHHTILKDLIYRETPPEEYLSLFEEFREKDPKWKAIPRDVIKHCLMPYLKHKTTDAKILNGSVSKKERVKIIREFQSDTNRSWCLIVSPGIASESISLHDVHGTHPREMLISPNHMFSQIIQSTGRINRVTCRSDCKIMLIFSKSVQQEISILESMVRKSQTARDLLAEGQKVTLPGEYPFWIEGKRDEDLEFRLNGYRAL